MNSEIFGESWLIKHMFNIQCAFIQAVANMQASEQSNIAQRKIAEYNSQSAQLEFDIQTAIYNSHAPTT